MRSNFNEKGEFGFGKFNYEKARETSEGCFKFKLDNDEEEMSCGGELASAKFARIAPKHRPSSPAKKQNVKSYN